MSDDLEISSFASAEDFAGWLAEHHDRSPGLWLKLRKRTPGVDALDFARALDVALSLGWTDGERRALDDRHRLQWFAPRRPDDKWTRAQRVKAEALLTRGRMLPPGLAEVARARQDGRWDAAYDGAPVAAVPDDLAAALAAVPAAGEFFEALDVRNRHAILYRIREVERGESRARRIERYVAMLAGQRRIYP